MQRTSTHFLGTDSPLHHHPLSEQPTSPSTSSSNYQYVRLQLESNHQEPDRKISLENLSSTNGVFNALSLPEMVSSKLIGTIDLNQWPLTKSNFILPNDSTHGTTASPFCVCFLSSTTFGQSESNYGTPPNQRFVLSTPTL